MRVNSNHDIHSHGHHGDLPIHQKVLEEIHKTHEKIQSDHNLTPDEKHEMSNKLKHLEDEVNSVQRGRGSDAEKSKAYEDILSQCSDIASVQKNNLKGSTEYEKCIDSIKNQIAHVLNSDEFNGYQKTQLKEMLTPMETQATTIRNNPHLTEFQKIARYNKLKDLSKDIAGNDPDAAASYYCVGHFLPEKPLDPGKEYTLPSKIEVPTSCQDDYNKLYNAVIQYQKELSTQLGPNQKYQLTTANYVFRHMLITLNTVIKEGLGGSQLDDQYITSMGLTASSLYKGVNYLPNGPSPSQSSIGCNEALDMIKSFKIDVSNNQSLNVNQKQSTLDGLDKKMKEMEKVRSSNISEQDKQNKYARIFQEAELLYNTTDQM